MRFQDVLKNLFHFTGKAYIKTCMLVLPNWPPCLCIVFRQKCAETCLEGAKLCAFHFHFSFGSTLDPDRTFLQFFVHTSGLAQTQIIERKKKKSQTQLAIKISLVIWQARNIFYNNFVTFHNYLLRRWADTDVLKCLRIFAQPKNSICLKQKFSITK